MERKAELFEKKTKIVATIGPASEDKETMRELIKSGVNVVRLNMSHGDFAEHEGRVKSTRELSKELDMRVSLLLDTKGPEIRIHNFENGKEEVKVGDTVEIFCNGEISGKKEGNKVSFSVTYTDLSNQVKEGDKILCDDGKLILIVKQVNKGKSVITESFNHHVIKNKKAVNIPGVELTLPFVSDYDKKAIEWGIKNGIDYIAASFVNSEKDIEALRKILKDNNAEHIQIMPKIESLWSLGNLNSILQASDAVMLARGDLGVEIPFEEVPYWEKLIVAKARYFGKPVVVATHMLDSMEDNPRPTRAEVTDVYYAASLGVDGVMLSSETAAGEFPTQAVETMSRIVTEAEKNFNYFDSAEHAHAYIPTKSAESAFNVVQKSLERRTDIIITISKTGKMIEALSRFRTQAPVIGVVKDAKLESRYGSWYGIYAYLVDAKTFDGIYDNDKEIERIAKTYASRSFSKERQAKGFRVIVSKADEFKVLYVN